MLRSFSIALLALGLAACGGSKTEPVSAGEAPAATEVSDSYSIDKAYVRTPMEGQANTAAYFTITSNSDSNALIVGVSATNARVAEMHSHSMSGGMMAMQKVDDVQLKAGESVEFRPLGYHIMLFDVDQDLKEGDVVSITLDIFSNSKTSRVTFDAPVRPLS